jgi:rhamnosyltransferase
LIDIAFHNSSVVAIIVSFNGGSDTVNCIRSIRKQVESVFVIDNGSSVESLYLLQELHRRADITLIAIPVNIGLGAALNLGVKKAMPLNFEWILTLDQDSLPAPNMVAKMLDYARDNSQAKSLSPNLVSRNGLAETSKAGLVKYVITSGNLIHRSIFESVGLYNSYYFIDCIDFDFSLRIRKLGFSMHKVAAAKMIHEVGMQSKLPQILRSFYSRHAPVRRYYMFRNVIFLIRSHFDFDFWFILKLSFLYAIFFVLLIIFEERRLVNLKCIALGLFDGVVGNDGPYAH